MSTWYYSDGRNKFGPVPERELRDLVSAGEITPDHLVWTEGMKDWQPARDLRGVEWPDQPPPPPATPQLIPTAGPTAGFGTEPGTIYAGFWRRVAAAVIDGIVLGFAGFILGFFLGLLIVLTGAGQEALRILSNVLGIAIAWLYHAILESSSAQATLGKLAIGIKVTDLEGKRIGFGRASGRYFGMMVSALILFIGFIMVGFTRKKQGLHDIMAGCLVVKK